LRPLGILQHEMVAEVAESERSPFRIGYIAWVTASLRRCGSGLPFARHSFHKFLETSASSRRAPTLVSPALRHILSRELPVRSICSSTARRSPVNSSFEERRLASTRVGKSFESRDTLSCVRNQSRRALRHSSSTCALSPVRCFRCSVRQFFLKRRESSGRGRRRVRVGESADRGTRRSERDREGEECSRNRPSGAYGGGGGKQSGGGGVMIPGHSKASSVRFYASGRGPAQGANRRCECATAMFDHATLHHPEGVTDSPNISRVFQFHPDVVQFPVLCDVWNERTLALTPLGRLGLPIPPPVTKPTINAVIVTRGIPAHAVQAGGECLSYKGCQAVLTENESGGWNAGRACCAAASAPTDLRIQSKDIGSRLLIRDAPDCH